MTMKKFNKHELFEKDVNQSEFTNQQIETIVHHFRQKFATLGNALEVVHSKDQDTEQWTDAIHDAEEAHLSLEQMLEFLESKYQ